MNILTQRGAVRQIVTRWKAAMVGASDTYGSPDQRSRKAVLAQLEALDLELATPHQVAEIIGNGSWTRLPGCSECREGDYQTVIQIGEEPDYESETAYICPKCLFRLADEVKEHLLHNPT